MLNRIFVHGIINIGSYLLQTCISVFPYFL